MIQQDRLVQLFKDLCLINAPAKAERESVDFVTSYLQTMGLEITEDKAGEAIGGNAGNLIAKLPANVSGKPTVFLSAHFDTVEPTAGLEIQEIDGVLSSKSDTILGADDKGGMAPAIEAIQCLIDSGEPHGDIYLLFCVAEEIGLLGAEQLDIQSLNIDYGFVLDTGPPVGSFVTRTATHDKVDFTIKGVPAHAGKHPEEGINAIQVLADAVVGMKLGRINEETTANLGIVSGGTAVNVVCPEAIVKGEARSTDPAEVDKQIDHMIKQFTDAANKWKTSVKVDHARHYGGYTISEDEPVVQVAQRAAKKLGMSGELRTTLGGSDANRFNVKGVPTIVLGTGMEKIHTHDEFISIQDLVDTARLAYEILVEVARDGA